jgi:hypothetical protein
VVHITDRAKEALLRKKLLANIVDRDVGLRLAAGPGGQLGLVPDRAKAGDEVVTHKDSTIFLVDPQMSALVIAGRTIDCGRDASRDDDLFLIRTRNDGMDPVDRSA